METPTCRCLSEYTVAVEIWPVSVFLAAVFLGSYVQGITGFALGVVVMAIVAAARVYDVTVMAAVISFLAFVNVGIALYGRIKDVDWGLWLSLSVGQIMLIGVGVWLLDQLSSNAVNVLYLILGAFIVAGSASMVLRPKTRSKRSPVWTSVAAGAGGGLIGGMFAASGPVIGWFAYRQPLPVATVRATLLAGYLVTTSTRSLLVGFGGGLSEIVWQLTALGLPVVALGTWLARRHTASIEEGNVRRTAFATLMLLGIGIIASAVFTLTQTWRV